jgi:MFS family permease
MRSLLRRSDVRLLLAGQSLSMFGDWMMIIVLGIWMKVLTQSNSAAGLVFFVFAAASLVAPLGGLLVDRLPKRPIMIATHVALAAVMCTLLFVHDRSDAWLLYAVTAVYGLGGDVFAAARASMMKAMLPDELLGDANAAFQSLREGLRLVAPSSRSSTPARSSPRPRRSSRCGSPSRRLRLANITSSVRSPPGSPISGASPRCVR